MREEQEEIVVSGKHLKLRIALFIVAVVVGVTAFAIGFYQLSNRKPGYYEITAPKNDEVPLYANGLQCHLYLTGSSSEIKEQLRRAEEVYAESLGRAYRLFDADTMYDGYVNLATLNARAGEDVALPVELYTVLNDSAAVAERFDYSPYDTVLQRMWEQLRYLEDPAPYDPLRSADEQARFAQIAALLQLPDSVYMEVVDEASHTVCLHVSQQLRDAMTELEIESPYWDLGVLREAYILRYVSGKLKAAGFTAGYLAAETGLHLLLPDTETASVTALTQRDGKAAPAAELTLAGGDACCILHSFAAADEVGYYAIDGVLRHPHLTRSGEPNGDLLTAWALMDDGNIVHAAAAVRALYASPLPEATVRLSTFTNGRSYAALIAVDAPETIRAEAPEGAIKPADGMYVTAP